MRRESPPKTAPQSARKPSKQHQNRHETHKAVQSDNDAYLMATQKGDQTPVRKKRQPRKKSNARKNGVQSDVGEFQDPEPTQRHSSYSGHPKSTPAKNIKSDAYAGPTFHQSPAPSALPMPSFFSKSVPNTAAIGPIAETTDGSSDPRREATNAQAERRETTPLDWMFNAARQARGTPTGASPARVVSPPSQSPVPSPAARHNEADFPFELDGVEENRSAYATPFTQRLAASRTPHFASEGGQPLTDEERKAKTAALKHALMNSTGSASLGSPFKDSNNPFNARNVSPNHYPPRHSSNPSTPSYQNGPAGPPHNPYFTLPPASPNRNPNVPPTNRPPSSSLRNVYDPAGHAPPMSPPHPALPPIPPQQRITTARSPPQPPRQLNFGAIYGGTSRPSSEGNPAGHAAKPSLEQGLDDLKKALNMNFLGQP